MIADYALQESCFDHGIANHNGQIGREAIMKKYQTNKAQNLESEEVATVIKTTLEVEPEVMKWQAAHSPKLCPPSLWKSRPPLAIQLVIFTRHAYIVLICSTT